MLKYNCNQCNFFTNNKTDYNRHLKTKKHRAKLSHDIPEKTEKIKCEKFGDKVDKPTQRNSAELSGTQRN